jgi:hypothetical protein
MTGLTWPGSMSLVSASRSGVFSEQISVVSVWPVNGGEEQRPELAVVACEPSSAGPAPDDDWRLAGIHPRAAQREHER